MSDISILKEMIKDTATVPLKDDHGKKKVILEEPPPANYSVTIHGMPDDNQTIIIKADVFKAPKEIFANSKHECKRSDFVIVADTDRKKVIICIELKAGKGKEIVQQLKGAQCFVAYCREIGQSFWNEQDFLKDYEYRFVSITNIGLSKRTTRPPKETDTGKSPDQMLKITSSKGIQFNHLIGSK
jgi:hypothetical protein